jgi:bifunctional non-homologous end joining protein LigD
MATTSARPPWSKGGLLHASDHLRAPGSAVLEEACRHGAEGIVCKRVDSEYRSGRTRTWLKVKCSRRQEFVIAGFTDPLGSRIGLGALLLAVNDAQGKLVYAGKVGTGFDSKMLRDLRERLGALERPTPGFARAPRGRGNHWVEPRLVAEVAFSEWTNDGRIRHPAFIGLREDKRPKDVRIEREQSPPG